jgi:hypothetical protein
MGILPVDPESDYGDLYPGESTVMVEGCDTYKDYIKLSPDYFKPGLYSFFVWGVPTDYQYADSIEDASYDFDVSEYEYAESGNFYIKKLKAPSGLRVHSGKHKVHVSFYSASGASRYEIYRSTSRYGSYKKVKTTSGTSFTDRHVRKGKKYYYKVRSVRSVRNTIRSSFSSVKKSGKVR